MHFVRDPWLDEEKVTGAVVDDLLEVFTIVVADIAFQDVKHQFKVDVNVSSGDRARRNGRDVHRQPLSANVATRQARLVVDAVPVATVRAGPENQDAVAFGLSRACRDRGAAQRAAGSFAGH